MSRKSPPEVDGDLVAVAASEADDADHHGFWDGPALDLEALDNAFAVVDDEDGEQEGERETLVYMGSVPQTQVDTEELMALADWAESKACPVCRSTISEHHEPAPRRHEGCRTALRVGALLRRYS